jgi:hypothetical protein
MAQNYIKIGRTTNALFLYICEVMEVNYSEAAYLQLVQDIFHRFPSVQKDGFTSGAYKPGLERMRAF